MIKENGRVLSFCDNHNFFARSLVHVHEYIYNTRSSGRGDLPSWPWWCFWCPWGTDPCPSQGPGTLCLSQWTLAYQICQDRKHVVNSVKVFKQYIKTLCAIQRILNYYFFNPLNYKLKPLCLCNSNNLQAFKCSIKNYLVWG